MHHAHPAATAAGDRLDHHRVSRALRPEELPGLLQAGRTQGRVKHRNAASIGQQSRPHLVAEDLEDFGPRSGKRDLLLRAPAGKMGILAQESVARMDQVAAGLPRDRHDLFEVEIGSRTDPAQRERFIRLDGMEGPRVILGKNRHRAHPQFGGGTEHADGNFASIGDQKAFRNHRLRTHPSYLNFAGQSHWTRRRALKINDFAPEDTIRALLCDSRPAPQGHLYLYAIYHCL